MIKTTLAVLASVSMLAMSAHAADLGVPVKAPVVAAPAFSWTGFYIGASAGYGWGNTSVPAWLDGSYNSATSGFGTGTGPGGGAPMTYNPTVGGLPPIPSTNCGIECTFSYTYTDQYVSGTSDPSGWFGGLQAGYNYQFANKVVLGVEADIYFGSLKSDTNAAYDTRVYYSQTFPNAQGWANEYDPYEEGRLNLESNLQYFGTARLRLGYAFDRFLPYVTGGLAWGYNKISASGYEATGYYQLQTPSPGTPVIERNVDPMNSSDSNYHVGWALGGGFEYAIDNHWSVKAEYVYADLGSQSYTFTSNGGNSFSMDYGIKLQTAKAGINYRF